MSQSIPGIVTFTLLDADGVPHNYTVGEHPAGDGMAIMYELLGLGAPTVVGVVEAGLKSGELIRAAWEAFRGGGGEAQAPTAGALMERVQSSDWKDFLKLLEDLDLSGVGGALEHAFVTGKAPALTRRVLAHTHRDGKPLSGPAFEQAYQANYWELLQAVWKVCQINRFFPLPSTSLGSLLAAAKA